MKLYFKMSKHCLIIFMMLIFVQSYAQVGINTTSPHPSAALDISSDTSGLLIPRMSKNARMNLSNPANSLLVYDTDYKMFFYYQNGQWYSLNAFSSTVTPNGGVVDTVSYTNGKVGIGVTNPTQSLEVLGNFRLDGSMIGNVNVTGTVSAPKLYGEGSTPAGGIIMWSGVISAIPSGWALCDGSVVSLPSGGSYATPNLSGRFIVGYDASDPEYVIGNTGPHYTDADGTSDGTNTSDAKDIKLLSSQSGLPSHSHSINDPGHTHNYDDSTAPESGEKTGTGAQRKLNWNWDNPRNTDLNYTGISIQSSDVLNASASFENRPPFYVLAYIIKLPY